MGEPLRLILIFAPLIAGAIAILLSFQLMKRYGVPFVSSYFYYLIFLYIFGVYSLIGSGVLEQLFIRMEIEQDTIHSVRLFMIFFGIPFMALSKFMLLRTIAEFFQKKIAPALTIFYFVIFILVFILYGFFIVKLTRFNQGDYQLLITVQRWVFLGFMVFMYLAGYLYIIILTRKQTGNYEKQFIRVFGSWYLLFAVLSCISFALIPLHAIVPHVFIFIFLSWHLIPILFLSIYLEKYHNQSSSVQDDFESNLITFAEKFEISKREQEVIHLICKGLSNQAIGDALFISLQTVKDHIHHIFLKTGVKNRIQLTNLIRPK